MRLSSTFRVCFFVSIVCLSCDAEEWGNQDGLIADSWVTTTATDYRGNWYTKKGILQQARKIVEELGQQLKQLTVSRDKVLRDCQALEQAVVAAWDSFGFDYAVGQAQVQKLIESTRAEQEDSEYVESLERLLVALNALHDISVSLADIQEIVKKQTETCNAYDQKAWDNYERISQVLNDVFAARLYQEMVSFLDTIGATQNYFSSELARFIQSSRMSLQEYEQQATELIAQLRQADVLEKLVKPEDKQVQKVQPEEKVPAPAQQPWYQQWFGWLWGIITNSFKSFWFWIKNIF